MRDLRVNEERKMRARSSQKKLWIMPVKMRVRFRVAVLRTARVLAAF